MIMEIRGPRSGKVTTIMNTQPPGSTGLLVRLLPAQFLLHNSSLRTLGPHTQNALTLRGQRPTAGPALSTAADARSTETGGLASGRCRAPGRQGHGLAAGGRLLQ
jgi:hypothetical protein